MMRSFLILYPERRKVSESCIRGWYLDKVADGELEPGLENPWEMALALSDIGVITVADEAKGEL